MLKKQKKKLKASLKSTVTYRFIKKAGQKLRHSIKRYLFRRKRHDTAPVFIFQMGKVASSSIYHSLRNSGYPGAVGHGHHVGPDNWQAQYLYDWSQAGKPLNIISTIREPIGRNVSAFFQEYHEYTGTEYEESTITLDQMKGLFLKNLDHDRPLIWFDENIKDLFNIDVFKNSFPPSGHITLSNNNTKLLIMRFDLDDPIKQNLIRDFLDFPGFKLERENVSKNKKYYKTYKEFTENVKLPDSYVEKMCNSKYFRHFFPEKEINNVREKWSRHQT